MIMPAFILNFLLTTAGGGGGGNMPTADPGFVAVIAQGFHLG
jgi:hypothetical protein